MAHDIFLSFSSKDFVAADSIRAALENADIRCWFAPRDLNSGAQWGGGIVEAIQASKGVLIVFSEHANSSPQVVREMESAVAKRLPLIPIRISNVMPTADMEFFLGVSHWFDAYANPLETYLPRIVTSVRMVLAKKAAPWQLFLRRLPQARSSQLAAAGMAVVAAVGTGLLMRPTKPPNFLEAEETIKSSRWQSESTDAAGRKFTCLMDVQSNLVVDYSDSCPFPLTGGQGMISIIPDGIFDPRHFTPGKNTGTFTMSGYSMHDATGTFRLDGTKHLILKDMQGREVNWTKIKADQPLKNSSDGILTERFEWPVRHLPQVAARALAYARSKWQPDAVLTNLKCTLNESTGQPELTFELYSPDTQLGLWLNPGRPGGVMHPMGTVDRRSRPALPATFLDLPDAVAALRAHGMGAKQIKEAQLEDWPPGTTYGFTHLSGLEWVIDSALGERLTVPARTPQN